MPSAEAVGHLRLILNADDFGLSEDTVAATIECFEAEALDERDDHARDARDRET